MRIGILAPGALSSIQVRALGPILRDPDLHVVGVLVDGRSRSRLTQLKSEWMKGRGGYILVMVVGALLQRILGERHISSVEYFDRFDPFEVRDSLASETSVSRIRNWQADVLLRFGFGILREPILSLCPLGVLSHHHGNVREFRGQPAGFWEVYEGAHYIGITVQRLRPELDAGDIVEEVRVPIRSGQSWASVYRMAMERSVPMMHIACRNFLDKDFEVLRIPRSNLGPIRTTPNLRQWLLMHCRVMTRWLVGQARRPRGAA